MRGLADCRLMRRVLMPLALALATSTLWAGAAWADPGQGDPSEAETGPAYLCTPRLQVRHPYRCGDLGPGVLLEDYARRGVYPERPLPRLAQDSALSELPYSYMRVGKSGARLYPSAGDALAKRNAYGSLDAGFLFVSWVESYEAEGQIVFRTTSGSWIRGDNVSRISTPRFQGLRFERTPDRPFGWVLTNGPTSTRPGYGEPETDHVLYRYQVVQVYDRAQVDGWEWYMVGPGEWIEQRRIAMADPDPTRPEGVEADRWISINLFEQTLTVYEQGNLIYATLVSSGLRGWWTQPGVFQVHTELEKDTMRGAFEADRSDYYYLEDVPWVLYYDKARALHGAYWHNSFGYPQSHGCVNLAPADARWIYDWAGEGTWVHVWDPTGETPTDDEAYGEGGA